MLETNYFTGLIYHMVHYANLASIFQKKAILSKTLILQEKARYRSIAYETVQNLRDRISVWDSTRKEFRSIHCYVPFYFAVRTPMLYVQYQKGIQDDIIIFEVDRAILRERGVLFTDGNASNQQLSINSREQVRIVPATMQRNICRRQYFPDGPHGSNVNCSNFYSDPLFLDCLNWDIINGKYFTGSERKRIKHAEVLVPDNLPLARIQGIAVNSEAMVKRVNDLITRCGLSGNIPDAMFKPEYYFR